VDSDRLDLLRFGKLVARAAAGLGSALDRCAQALACWRGLCHVFGICPRLAWCHDRQSDRQPIDSGPFHNGLGVVTPQSAEGIVDDRWGAAGG
jgi:hypothetical protein